MFKREGESKGPMNVAFYVRVSTDKQANKEDGSLDTQLDRLAAFVEYRRKQGQVWVVTEKIVEGERNGLRRGRSGKDTDRPGLKRLLDLARARMIDIVVVTKIDRISRSVVDFLQLVRELRNLGVAIVSLHEDIDMTSPHGKFQTTLLIALAEHEREMISARTKEKTAWRAEKGLPIGPPPIGYRMQDKMFVIDEPFAKHVRDCDRIYLEHGSANVVLREFERLGYRTRGGKRYMLPKICHMLRNPTYIGKLVYGGNLYDAQWPAIRSLETHKSIQAMMDKNIRTRHGAKRKTVYPYLLQGLLQCGVCAHAMTPMPGTGRNGKHYPYYSCASAQKSLGATCPRSSFPADVVDRAIIEYLKKLQLDHEMIRKWVSRANETATETGGKLAADLARVREQLAAVRSRLGKMVDAVGDRGKAALATLGAKMEALEAERAELETTEARIKAEIEATTCQVISVQEQIRTLSLFKHLVELNANRPDRIKAMLPGFIDHVVWREENGTGSLEVALFPTPFVRPEDTTFKAMVDELVAACGSTRVSVRPGLADGVPDGI